MNGIKDKEEEGKKAGVVYVTSPTLVKLAEMQKYEQKNIEPTPGMDTLSNWQWHNMRWRAIS